jgi:GAF domain-containing protein
MLESLLTLATLEIPGSSGASITLRDEGTFRTSVHTSELFRQVDGIQYEETDGPCLQAIRTGEITHADFRDTERWPRVGPRSMEFGVKQVISAPLTLDGHNTGSLNVYATSWESFGAATEETVRLVAEVLVILLRNFELYDRRGEVIDQLQSALESRSTIDLAKGMLMEREGLDSDSAFTRLRRESQARNIKLRDVATRIVQAAEKRAS